MTSGGRSTGRILDAATNRAAEALRVMEDAARFLLDDRSLCAEIKALRHDLRALTPSSAPGHRDTPGDVGTDVSTESENVRRNERHVVAAACKRLQESLRSLEEWSKLSSCSAAAGAGVRGSTQSFEALRYRAYTLESQLMSRLPQGDPSFKLCLLLTESLCKNNWLDVAREAVSAGTGAVQLREKELDGAELLRRSTALLEAVGDRAAVIVNDRLDVALAAGAHGVHLGQTDLPLHVARDLAGGRLLIGVSTANLEQARAAEQADYCGVGPMFPSETKRKDTLAGPAYLAEYLAHDLPPALAISGVTPETIPQLTEAANGRPFGVAVSSFVCCASDPARATGELLSALPAPAGTSTLSPHPSSPVDADARR